MDANAVTPPEGGGTGRQAASPFGSAEGSRELRHEAKHMIEVKFGQIEAGEHRIQTFNDWLEKLPDELALSRAAATNIEHFLASLSPLVPTDLEESYDPPRKTLTDEHAQARHGQGFASLTATHDRILVLERPVP